MNKELEEIFYNGRIINLSSEDIGELSSVLVNLRNDKVVMKEKIENVMNQIRGAKDGRSR